jgi:hypothetical protein
MQTHDEFLDSIFDILNVCNSDEIITAFIGSLSTRNLAARSAFGSYIVLKHIFTHNFTKSHLFSGENCSICGLTKENNYRLNDDSVNNYPYQIQHTNIKYSFFDLQTFRNRKINKPNNEDINILKGIIESIRCLPCNAQLNELNSALQGKLKSNKYQRMIFLETFGYAGILKPSGHLCYKDEFLNYDYINITQPSEYYKKEWAYPIRFWTGNDGVNEENLEYYFGKYLS